MTMTEIKSEDALYLHQHLDRLDDKIDELNRKIDAIVEIVEKTIGSLESNPMMKMLGNMGKKK